MNMVLRADREIASHFEAVDAQALLILLRSFHAEQLIVAEYSEEKHVLNSVEFLDEVLGNDAFEGLDALEANALLDEVHVGLVVPATYHDELALLALGVLRAGKLNVKNGRHRLEPLLNCNIWLVLIFLSLGPDLQDEGVALTGTVEDEAVVEVDETAAESQLRSKELNRDELIHKLGVNRSRTAEFVVKNSVKRIKVESKHEKLTSLCCEDVAHERASFLRLPRRQVILIDSGT